MKTVKQIASEKAAYWSLNANCGVTLRQAMADVIDKDGDGYEFYVPKPFSQGEYSHFLTKFGGSRVVLLRLVDGGVNVRLMKAEQDGTIWIHAPLDEDDAALQNMWLQQVGVPWRVTYNVDGGKWHLADAAGLTAADFPTTGRPHIKVYAVHSEPADTAKAPLAFYNCYQCGMTLHEADHQPAYYKAGYWAHYNTGDGYIAPCHHFCCQDEWQLADDGAPIL